MTFLPLSILPDRGDFLIIVNTIASRRNPPGWRFFLGMGILKREMGRFRFPTTAALVLAGCIFIGCTSAPVDGQPTAEDCLGEASRRVRRAPEKKYLQTLDGQAVRLQEFFNQCRERAPDCILFAKFYHWENEVQQVVSMTDSGPVEHRIRVYYNPLSICRPQKTHPGRTHGDVAEFYDARGRFMGLAVYMGQGQYFLLYYSGYRSTPKTP